MATTSYIPGVCNIGPAEIKSRRLTGHAGLILTVILLVLILVLDFPRLLRLVIFIPVALGATGYLQTYYHFCVRFGTTGLFNMGTTLETVETVDQVDYRRKDQQKALKIAGLSVLIAALVTAIVFVLPGRL
jgi:hypothetical protein